MYGESGWCIDCPVEYRWAVPEYSYKSYISIQFLPRCVQCILYSLPSLLQTRHGNNSLLWLISWPFTIPCWFPLTNNKIPSASNFFLILFLNRPWVASSLSRQHRDGYIHWTSADPQNLCLGNVILSSANPREIQEFIRYLWEVYNAICSKERQER